MLIFISKCFLKSLWQRLLVGNLGVGSHVSVTFSLAAEEGGEGHGEGCKPLIIQSALL